MQGEGKERGGSRGLRGRGERDRELYTDKHTLTYIHRDREGHRQTDRQTQTFNITY